MKIENLQFESNMLAILPERLNHIIAKREQLMIQNVDIAAAINRRATKFNNIKGKVVTVPLHGYISHKATIWSAMGIETSSETFGQWLEALVGNADVGAIVIDIDSPGGTVLGATGVTDKIFSMRGTKPIIAVVNDMMASAAYFIGSAADEIVSDPDALTGSIGTILVHMDWSQFLENEGIKPTIIKAGNFKAEGNPYEELTDDAKENFQNEINAYYENFVASVARNRGITVAKVKSTFGQGRVLRAEPAKSVGMIDRIATLENVINDLLGGKGKSKSRARAELDVLKMS